PSSQQRANQAIRRTITDSPHLFPFVVSFPLRGGSLFPETAATCCPAFLISVHYHLIQPAFRCTSVHRWSVCWRLPSPGHRPVRLERRPVASVAQLHRAWRCFSSPFRWRTSLHHPQ